MGDGVMKKFLLATAAAIAIAAPAQAADLPVDLPVKAPPVVAVDTYSWTGCYIGGHAGGAVNNGPRWTNVEGTHFFTAVGQVDTFRNQSRFIGGGQIGCNYQVTSNFLVGVESTFSLARFNQQIVRPGPFSANTLTNQTSDIWTLAGRVGFVQNRWMVYAKGGIASVRVRIHATEVPFFDHFLEDRVRHYGFIGGVGAEFLAARNIVIGAEYNVIGLQARNHIGVDNIAFDPRYVIRVDPRYIHSVTGRVSFLLGPSPVVARY
jgi:outer membrane immunogenic protein